MKKVTRSIFLIVVLVIMSSFSMAAYAEPGETSSEVTLSYQLSAGGLFKLYISESDTETGKELLYKEDVSNYVSGSTKLDPAKTYYLHIYTTASAFISKFELNGVGLEFNNHTNTFATSISNFRYSDTGFGKNNRNIVPRKADTSDKIPSSLDPAKYIMFMNTPVYMSTEIKPARSVLSAHTTYTANSVNVTWNSIPGATSYSVERSTTPGGPYTPIASDLTETSYTDKSVTANTTYYYIVKAKMSDTETVTSAEVSGTPTSETPTVDSKLKVVLEPEEKLQLSVDDHLDENTNMTWTSSDSTVAQVDENGVVTAIKAGNAVIHVKSKSGNYSDDINVLVVDNANEYRLAVDLNVGKTSRLTVDDLMNTINVTWDSSDSSVATVSSKGVVTAKGKGLALAMAKDNDGNVVGQVYIRVREV